MSNPVSLSQFITDLKTSRRMALASVKAASSMDVRNLMEELKLRSPLDKGLFRRNWETSEMSRTSGKSITHRIQNRTFYAPYLDQGVEPGSAPWYWPSSKNPGDVSKSGKLAVINGRVWAGGKSPAGNVGIHSGDAPLGGIIDPVIYYNRKRQIELANRLADAVIGAL